jgi:hypothetical protein
VSSVAAVAARRLDRGQRVEINLDDGLKRLGCRGASKCVGQGFELGGIGGLKFDQFSDGIVPTSRPGPAVDWLARADHD